MSERYTQAAEVAHREAQQAGERLNRDQMAAAIRRHYTALAQQPAPDAPAELPPIVGLPAPPMAEAAGPSPFELLYQQWVGEQSRRANPRSGLRLSKSYLDSLQGTRRSQDFRIRERLCALGLARDKLLECCYFGLRISDANRLAPRHLKGELARVRAGKT